MTHEKLRIEYTLSNTATPTVELIDWPKNKFKSEANFLEVASDYLHSMFGGFYKIISVKMYNQFIH
jgi:ferritin